ncbi:MAG: HDOD domain-containing protein, partial [Leptothrix sp. (in: b-proteobacteria)]
GQAVLLVNSRGIYADLLARRADDPAALLQAERAAFGVTHAAYGSALCASWGLAPDVVKFVRERATPAAEWTRLDLRVQELLALGSAAELLVSGTATDARTAAEQATPGTGLPSQALGQALHAPWTALYGAIH